MKKEKSEVDYSQGHANSRCGICTYYREPHSCTLVRGEILPHMWCELFKREKDEPAR